MVGMRQPTTRQLVDRVVEEDLLGPDVLFGTDVPAAPQGYELIERIGQGGGGIVYLARDTNLDRLAAIKFLTDAGPADLLRQAVGVGDAPIARAQLHRALAVVLNFHVIRPDVVILIRFGMLFQIDRFHRHADGAGARIVYGAVLQVLMSSSECR